jgi:HSP20 family protein
MSQSPSTEVNKSAQQQPRQSAQQQPAQQTERSGAALMPPVDVLEDANGITLFADLPGVSKDKLNLQVEADTLIIEGEVTIPTPEGLEASYAEVGMPRYRRMFTLSKELDPGKVTAELNNGVLKLRIPKAEHAKPRRIQVQAS